MPPALLPRTPRSYGPRTVRPFAAQHEARPLPLELSTERKCADVLRAQHEAVRERRTDEPEPGPATQMY